MYIEFMEFNKKIKREREISVWKTVNVAIMYQVKIQ